MLGFALCGGFVGGFVPGLTAAITGLVIALVATTVLVATLPWGRLLDSVTLLRTPSGVEPPVESPLTPLEERLGAVDGWLTLAAPEQQVSDAERALAANPRDGIEWLRVGLARECAGQGPEADLRLGHVIESGQRDGDLATHRYALALAHAAREEHECAIAALEPLLTVGGAGAASPWTARARLRRCMGDLDGALRDADEAVRLARQEEPWPHAVRGRLRMLRGDLAGALADLDSAVMRSGPHGGPLMVRAVLRLLADDADAYYDLHAARAREPMWAAPRLWMAALGDEAVNLDGLTGFDADLARCLRGEVSGSELLASARAWPWGERARRSRLRRAHGLLALVTERRGDAAAASEHLRAVLALPDDGGLERDWAVARAVAIA